MYSPCGFSETSRSFLTWQPILDWAQSHYRIRSFSKDEHIPTRPGLLYLVQKGTVRLVGTATATHEQSKSKRSHLPSEEACLSFVCAGQPYEIVTQSLFTLHSYAHVNQTVVVWMYWNELDNWPHFRREVQEAFRYQYQRQLLLLSALGQTRTIDRLFGYLTLLIEEYGEASVSGVTTNACSYCLPFPITHAQISSALGVTRVTITRMMGKLRQRGLLITQGENDLCLPANSVDQKRAVSFPDD